MKKVLVTDSLFIYPEHEALLAKADIEVERLDKPKASEEELITALEDKDGYILGGIEHVTKSVIERVDKLQVIAFTGTAWKGFIPGWELATKKGIKITNAPHANASAVAEWAYSVSLAMNRELFDLGRTGAATFKTVPGVQDLHVGIIGMGHIGSHIGKLFEQVGARRVTFWNRSPIKCNHETQGLDDLLSSADIVFVCVSSEAGKDFIDNEKLSMLKDKAIITCLTDSVVDEAALLKQLEAGRVRAFLDWTPKIAGFKQLPLSVFYCSNESTAFNTQEANRLASDIVTRSMINILSGVDDPNIVNSTHS